jgi:hypothetical protein
VVERVERYVCNQTLPAYQPKACQCAMHGGKCCILGTAIIHVAGTPCVDWSPIGPQGGESGDAWLSFVVWVLLRRIIMEPIVIHENSSRFPLQVLLGRLAPFYWPLVIGHWLLIMTRAGATTDTVSQGSPQGSLARASFSMPFKQFVIGGQVAHVPNECEDLGRDPPMPCGVMCIAATMVAVTSIPNRCWKIS